MKNIFAQYIVVSIIGRLFIAVIICLLMTLTGCTFAPQVNAFNNRSGMGNSYAGGKGYSGQAAHNAPEGGAEFTFEGNQASLPGSTTSSTTTRTSGGGQPNEADGMARVNMPPRIEPSK